MGACLSPPADVPQAGFFCRSSTDKREPSSKPEKTGYSLDSFSPITISGTIGMNGYYVGQAVAPNGEEHNELFSVDLGSV
jgi:hypothetical protein